MTLPFRKFLKPQSDSVSHGKTSAERVVKWVRDRGLDHAVEREKNLKPLLNIKDLIKAEPSKSLPITMITQKKDSLQIPIRPIDFIRKYPSVFQEFLPGNIGVHPHIKLTPQVLDLDAEEQLVYQSQSYKQLVADRLLKLLMISRSNRMPLCLLDILKWDLGLPQDYLKSVVPEFPDYFRVVDAKNNISSGIKVAELELVCWSNELAISVIEKKAIDKENIVFSMNFPSGFEMDKKMKKWLHNWQKLPYISPYEYAGHLSPTSDEADKWAVAISHELLSLFGAKKVERDNFFSFGEYLGIRSLFKRALLNHPGIFYVSSKIGTYTVVLKEAYKRGSLIESDPLMNITSQYIHLMNTVKEDRKVIAEPSESKKQVQGVPLESKGGEQDVEDDDDSEEENDVDSNDLFGSEEENGSNDDSEDYDEEEGTAVSRETTTQNMNLVRKGVSKKSERGKSMEKHLGQSKEKVHGYSRRREMRGGNNVRKNSGERLNYTRSRRSLSSEKKASV
ncbi:protein ROOT PRIMORDIUM DEFECTIVE 1 [Melia azedarach]|uniref:Protein ROOT PRIMORDIUM DEFECTIVE 1 n=1 Tax=Melia azedarach TaxID=155640 RepID=A0ACC1WQ13_MELAZ|nr:protein ROOT PRIMORDIUM DEFECTIVE 1 [Melia azedarach]